LTTLEPIWATEVARLLPELAIERPGLPAASTLREKWQRQRFFESIARAMLSQAGPLILFLDDMQWCDRETLEWLHFMLRFDPSARLMLLGTVRVEELDDTGPLAELLLVARRNNLLTEINIGPLDETETRSLAALVSGRDLSTIDLARLFHETEGNPLFIVETVRAELARPSDAPAILVDSSQDHGSSPAIPPTVQALIKWRLAHLSPATRDLIGLAAVIGREFTFEVLVRASEETEETILTSIDELWQRRVVRECAAPAGLSGDAYDFSHDKFRETIYSSLSPARRRQHHRRVAEAFVTGRSSDIDTVSAQVGHHFEQAGLIERAVEYYRRAAEVAERMYGHQKAIRYYHHALALLGQASGPATRTAQSITRVELSERLGDVHHLTGQPEDARSAHQSALRYVLPGDQITLARLHRKVGNTWRDQHRYDDARRAYTEAISALGEGVPIQDVGDNEVTRTERTPDSKSNLNQWWQEWIEIQLDTLLLHYWLAQIQDATELLARVRPRVEEFGSPSQRAHFFQQLAIAELRRERYAPSDETVAHIEKALAEAQTATLSNVVPAMLFGLAFTYLWHGDLENAEQRMLASLELAEQTGDVSLQARCITYLTIVSRKKCCVDEVERYAARSLDIATSAHMPEYVATATANQAWVAWHRGDMTQAETRGRTALEQWTQLPPGHATACFQWTALWPLIGVALRQGETSRAVAFARLLLQPTQQRLPSNLTTSLETAIRALEGGDLDRANVSLARAMAWAEHTGYF
jgi:tetratricopeptide (TPR) repeat protein